MDEKEIVNVGRLSISFCVNKEAEDTCFSSDFGTFFFVENSLSFFLSFFFYVFKAVQLEGHDLQLGNERQQTETLVSCAYFGVVYNPLLFLCVCKRKIWRTV